MDLSIIFVNWNSLAFLRECLKSIYARPLACSLEIIIVDNDSPDKDIHAIKQEFPNLRIIESNVNLGFAGANNLGYRNSSGEFLLFLNPDTEVLDGSIETLMGTVKTIPDAGIVGCKLLNTDGSIQTSCIQTFPTILNQVLDIEALRMRWPACPLWNIAPLFSESTSPASVEVISGACMMVSRKVFEKAGLFSEDYFMYAEDLDLCYKVRGLGLKNYYIGYVSAVHHGGKSSSQKLVSQWSTTMKMNSVEKFCSKTKGQLYASLYRISIGMAAIVRLLVIGLLQPSENMSMNGLSAGNAWAKWCAILRWAAGLDKLQTTTNSR
jgi:N-acetylglucosaminyl-diphospho-decaprenol L-rhamnosyltransferase